MIPHPPAGWHRTDRGGLRRRLDPASVLVYRRLGRAGWIMNIELVADASDESEAAALAEAVAASWVRAHQAVDSTNQPSARLA